uniref:gamma-tubulin complex component 5-like n=1 Tax=Myxine glutinosa TaxID=7769 RepID=UPI00358EFC88
MSLDLLSIFFFCCLTSVVYFCRLLSGARNLFVFKEEEGRVIVNKDIAISHLTQVGLYNLLCSVAKGGEAVRELQTFIDETVGWAKEHGSSTQAGASPCRTLQAFAWGLGNFLQELGGVIRTLEQSVSQADKTMTLLMLLEQLEPWLERLGVLRQLLADGVRALSTTAPTAHRTTRLLNSLHATLLHYDWSGHCGQHMVPLLLQLWLVTIQPYLDILEGWIGAGCLDDPLEEFVVQRNKGVSVHDNDFWNCTYSTLQPLQQNTSIASSKLPGTVNSSEDPNDSQSIRTPKIVSTAGVTFLEPILQQVKHAGKSMELLLALSELDTTDKLLDTCKKSHEPSLALQFIQTFLAKFDHRVLGLQQCFPGIDLPSGLISPTAAESVASYHPIDSSCSSGFAGNSKEDMKNMTTSLFSQLPVGVCPDQLFAHSFSRLFFSEIKAMDPQNNKSLPEVPVIRDCFEDDGKSLAGGLCCQHFQLVLQECLYPHIQRRCEFVFRSLVQKLKQQHRLLDCMEELRSSFLLQANGGMAEFATWLFEQAASALPSLHHVTELNVQLQHSLLAFQPKLANRLSVVLQNVDDNKKHLLIHVLNGVGLHYKVCWPINLVVTDETQQLLNQVFLLLLQIKYVKHRLDTLRFDELLQGQSEPLGACMHLARRMFLLRMRLLHFVSSLNTYLITRILHSTVLEFVPRLEDAENLQQLIDIHEQYVRCTHERCLLHEQASIMREAIMKVLDLALQFAVRWQAGLSTVRVEVITRVEKDVRNFLSFLLTLLGKATSRGSFPHLESLMLALLAGAEAGGVRQHGVEMLQAS